MRDYWLSRFFFEMASAEVRQRFADDPVGVMRSYRLSDDTQRAVLGKDFGYLAPRTNPYLLRYYFGHVGMTDVEFLARIRATAAQDEGRRSG